MSISGQQTINIGLPNESTGSDPLRTAFQKINNNFTNLFTTASPFNTFNASDGIGITTNANTGTVTITNTGVTSITAGTGVSISGSTGDITISAIGGNGNGSGTVTSVGLQPASNTRLTVSSSSNGAIVSSGTFTIDLASSGANAGSYINPNVTIDTYGRVTSIANGSIAGTVTSVGLTPGTGIQVSGGPVTSNGNITVTNTGVVRINPGAGIAVSSGNGNVTISATSLGGTVTSVGITSSQLVVSGSPVVSSGVISVNLPNSATFTGTVTAGNVRTDNLLYANGTAWDLQEAAGTNNQIQFNSANNFAASANLTFNPSTNILTVTGNVAATNISASGIANITGNANVGNLNTGGVVTATGNVTGGNLVTAGSANVTGNVNAGNLVLATGNIIYTPRYGSFYSNATQSNPVANTAMAMTFNNTPTANGVSVVANSQLTVAKAGIYNIQFSAQLTKTDAGSDYIEIWLSKNGSTVPWTNTRFKLDGSNTYQLATLNFVESLGATEYVELMWGSADLNAKLIAIDSANTTMGVDVPSVIATIVPVGA